MGIKEKHAFIDTLNKALTGSKIKVAGLLVELCDGHSAPVMFRHEQLGMNVYCSPYYDVPEDEDPEQYGKISIEVASEWDSNNFYAADIPFAVDFNKADLYAEVRKYAALLDAHFSEHAMTILSVELDEFYKATGYEPMCALEAIHEFHDILKPNERTYLSRFHERWEYAANLERQTD